MDTPGHHYYLDTTEDLPTLKLTFFHNVSNGNHFKYIIIVAFIIFCFLQGTVSSTDLGAAELDLSSLPSDGTELNVWLPLKKVGRMQNVTGEVQ